jgi:hypothetical protein
MLAGMLIGLGTTDAAAPQKITHVPALLSDSDVAAIKSALIAEWRGSNGPEFAKIIASADPAGTITVCGSNNDGAMAANVLKACRERGLYLIPE